ncbi:MAG: LysR family transcriptional regulator [Myxococcota bacterium]
MDSDALQILIQVARTKSFAAVARERGVAGSSISRTIAALEQELGVRLLQRNTRKVSVTEAGESFIHSVEPLVKSLERAKARVRDAARHPRGLLRITASPTFALLNLVPLLPEFSRRYPEIRLELVLTDALLDLTEGAFDIAIRQGDLPDSSMVAHRLCTMTYVCCAAPSYLRDHGTPERPVELAEHQCLRYPVRGYGARWLFRTKGSRRTISVSVSGSLTLSLGMAIRECAVRGMGVAVLPRWNVAADLASKQLIRLFPRHEVTASTFRTAAWLLFPSRAHLPPKVRVFRDFVKSAFRAGAPAERGMTPFSEGRG